MGKWTRRGFITAGVVAGTGLVVGVALRPGHRAPGLAPLVTSSGESLVNAWVKIGADNHITAIVPHSEMGQGAQTALTQMLADEMDAAWADISFIEAPAEDEYANGPLAKGYVLGDVKLPAPLIGSVSGAFQMASGFLHLQSTGGSASIRATGVYGMRVAGAAAREMLIEAAAAQWQVPAAELSTQDTHIIHAATGRREPFAALAARAGELTPPSAPDLKSRDDFNIMGRSVQRLDIPAKVDGTAQFGIDARVPGMKYAAILGAPVFGASIEQLDAALVEALPSVRGVVNLGDAVVVVADGYWQASQALKQLNVTWSTTGNESVASEQLFARFEADLARAESAGDTTIDAARGDLTGAFDTAHRIVESSYRVPYLAHTPMEPMNATARFDNDQCDVWLGCQNPLGFRHEIAEALGLDAARVRIHQHFMGGGFGRRAYADVAIQAARVARASGVPVKLIYSREEDVRHDFYRPAVASKFRAALSETGDLVAWENIYHEKLDPIEAPLIPYQVPALRVQHTSCATHVPLGIWRSVDHSQHGFFTESFFDEVAIAAGKDPYQLRRDMLADQPRHRAVLDLAADKADWGQTLAPGRGRGIALQASFGSIVAQVVDVTVTNGVLSVDRVVCAIDCGFAVSPDGVAAQMESGIIYGLTAALHGDIEISKGAVKQSNFHDYKALRMDEAPIIETHILNSGAAWGGAGEPGTPALAPALTAAIHQATGLRIRELPVSKHDLSLPVEIDDMPVTG